MITPAELSTLYNATKVRGIAKTSEAEALKGAVAKAINYAANTGERRVKWVGIMTDELLSELESYGYTVTLSKDPNQRDVKNVYIISF